LSALTKILIVLLSLFSIFLCGTVVTYVGTAKNYKQAFESAQTEIASLKQTSTSDKKQLEEKKREMQELSDKLTGEMSSLKIEKTKLEQDLDSVKRDKATLDEKVQTLAAAALKFEGTVSGMEGSLKETRAELDKARAEGVKLSKNLGDITASLEEKMVQIETLNAEKKRLLEDKAKLENQLAGKAPTPETTEPITPMPAESATKAIEPAASTTSTAIQGKITAIEGKLVTLSIGKADGIQKGMIFHVTRNDAFICDIKITEVDAEVSAGTLQLVQQQPQIGDIAATTW
jgi:chromosome segregation ATPase